MALHINNPEVERLARELARLEGETLTSTIRSALERSLAARREQAKPFASVEEALDWTSAWRREAGLPVASQDGWTKEDWDSLWPIGISEPDRA